MESFSFVSAEEDLCVVQSIERFGKAVTEHLLCTWYSITRKVALKGRLGSLSTAHMQTTHTEHDRWPKSILDKIVAVHQLQENNSRIALLDVCGRRVFLSQPFSVNLERLVSIPYKLQMGRQNSKKDEYAWVCLVK